MTRRERAAAPTGTRRAAREFAFRVLFESEQGSLSLPEVFERAEHKMAAGAEPYEPLNGEALAFARELAYGYHDNATEIDDLLRRTIRGWSFEQMTQTDLNVLRLAAYEMTRSEEPHPPVIESAVRVARKYGGEDSGRFVNGVLGGLTRKLSAAKQP